MFEVRVCPKGGWWIGESWDFESYKDAKERAHWIWARFTFQESTQKDVTVVEIDSEGNEKEVWRNNHEE